MASVAKDFHRLMKRVGKLTDGQASISDINWDEGNLQQFNVIIRPNSGLYKNGKFKFEIKLLENYPEIPPVVWCHTDIYHPNIDPTEENCSETSTNVCLNLLEIGVWSQSFGLEGTVLGLLFLMHNPNLDDPLSPYFEGVDDFETYREKVRKYMADEQIDDLNFKKDFCVEDGDLVEDLKPDASAETDNSATTHDMLDAQRNEHNDETSLVATKADDIDSTANTDDNKPQNNDNHASNKTTIGVNTELVSGEHHTHLIDNNAETSALLIPESVISDENNDNVNNANDIAENQEEQQRTDSNTNFEQTAEDAVKRERYDTKNGNNECEFELVSMGGECVLLRRNSGDKDMNMEEPRACSNTNDTISVISNISVSVGSESTNQTSASTCDSVDTKPETNDPCHTAQSYSERINDKTDMNNVQEAEDSLGVHAMNEQTVMIQKVPNAACNNVSSQSKNIACGLVAVLKYGLYKIVRIVVQHKLYQDCSI